MVKKLIQFVVQLGVLLALIEVRLPGKYFWYKDTNTDHVRKLLNYES